LPRKKLVFQELIEDGLCRAAFRFQAARAGKGVANVLRQATAGCKTEPFYGFDKRLSRYDAHTAYPPSGGLNDRPEKNIIA